MSDSVARWNRWDKHIEYLKECMLPNGQGDIKKISNYLQKLSDEELWEIEAFLQMGQYGVPDFGAVLDAQIEQLEREPREDVMRRICGRSSNIKQKLESVQIIRHGG